MDTPQEGMRHRPVSRTEPLIINVRSDSEEEGTTHDDQARNVYPPGHAKRLTTYAKTAILITFSLIVALYSTKLDTEENKMFILASFTSLIFALLFELVLFMLIDCVETPDPYCFRCRYEEKLYITIYVSNSLKMLAAFFLLLLCTYRYAYLAVFLILSLLVICILLKQGSKLKHTTSIKKYRGKHDSDLNHFSELSSAVVLMLFAGLSTIVFSSPDLSRKNDQIKVTECFLFVTLVMSLLLMLFTSVPPAVENNRTRDRMVIVVKFLFYTVVSILTLVGLMAAGVVLQGLVVFSTLAHIIGATYWLVTEVLDEYPDPIEEQGQGEQQPSEEQGHGQQLRDQEQGQGEQHPHREPHREQHLREQQPSEEQGHGEQLRDQEQGQGEQHPHREQHLREQQQEMVLHTGAMVLANGAFSVLMYVYSKNVDNCEPHNWGYFLVLSVCMISLCSTFIGCLCKMVIFSHNQESPSSKKAKAILDNIVYISLFVALVSTIVLVFLISGHKTEKSCN